MSLLLSAVLLACSDSPQQTGAAASAPPQSSASAANEEMTPEQLGELGAKITKQSGQAREILSQHGLDEKSFEAKIRKVTEDPDASRRYAAAFEKAKA